MNACPPELHSSKYFNKIAGPFLYQSIFISGPKQISSLASRLGSTPPHLRRIRHLFISDEGGSDPAGILTFATSTLETLTYISRNPANSTQSIARLFRLSFPHLRELTISCYYPFPSSPGKFPRLTHLHLHGNRNPHGLLQLGGLDGACPSLSHLRVSGLSMAVSFAEELQEAFSEPETNTTDLFPSEGLPAHVECVIVQPGSLRSTKSSEGEYLPAALRKREEAMMEKLTMVRASATKGVRFEILEGSDVGPFLQTLRQHWVDRLGGCKGAWA